MGSQKALGHLTVLNLFVFPFVLQMSFVVEVVSSVRPTFTRHPTS